MREHYPALAADLRSRFGISINDLGVAVSWREAIALVEVLSRDITTHLAASVSGWSHPMSRLEMFKQMQINSQLKDHDRLPWPWDKAAKPIVTDMELAALEAELDKTWANRPTT